MKPAEQSPSTAFKFSLLLNSEAGTSPAPSQEEDSSVVKIRKFNSTNANLRRSIILHEGYFEEDTDTLKRRRLNLYYRDYSKMKAYYIKFRWSVFFEYFLYHMLFFALLGPFCSLLLYWFTGIHLLNNIMFTRLGISFFLQTFLYLINLLAFILYFTFDCPNIYFDHELLFVLFAICIRAFSISAKYATFDSDKLELIKKNTLQVPQMTKDYMLAA